MALSAGSEGKRYQTASLSSLAARKATFLLALIWIGSPVAVLRVWVRRMYIRQTLPRRLPPCNRVAKLLWHYRARSGGSIQYIQ